MYTFQFYRREEAYKTALCDAYKKGGKCSYGDACRFAHGEHELRLPAQVYWKKFNFNRSPPAVFFIIAHAILTGNLFSLVGKLILNIRRSCAISFLSLVGALMVSDASSFTS